MRVDGKQPNQEITQDTEKGKTKKEKSSSPKSKATIHNVILLDASSSMNDGYPVSKYKNGVKGVQALIKAAKEDDDNDNFITIMEFQGGGWTMDMPKFTHHCRRTPALGTPDFPGTRGSGGTPLNQAIGMAIENASYQKPVEEKVLLTIFTDGEENTSVEPYKNPLFITAMVEEAEKNGFTVTFVGTEKDTAFAIKNYGMSQSNTMSYDGTAAGLEFAMVETVNAKQLFSKKVAKGEDVSRGFYSKSVDNGKNS